MDKVFIKEIKIEQILPCIADPKKIRFDAYFEKDISEFLPYLNAIIKGGIYNPNCPSLTIRKEGRLITVYSYKVSAGKIIDEKDAREILNWLKDLINYCYNNKDKIKPNFERKDKLTALDIYKLLPNTNCRKCGELTCMSFAIKLSNEEIDIMMCKDIFLAEYTEKRDALFNILKSAGYEVPDVF